MSNDEIEKLKSLIKMLQRRNGELSNTVTKLESYRSMAAPKLGCYEHEIERLDAEIDGLGKAMGKIKREVRQYDVSNNQPLSEP